MHKIFKYSVFLCIMSMFLLVINIDKVNAECYKVTEKNNSYYSSTVVKGDNITSFKVDDSNCNSINSSVKNYEEKMVSCGDGLLTDLPSVVPKVVHIIYLIIQILIPVLIVIFGSIDFVKAVIAQKDDEIKKGQQVFIKRLIAGIIFFFVFAIVKVVVSFAADSEKTRILDCASCIINNNNDCVVQ